MILTKKQTKALDILEDNTTTELYYGGAAGGGKSVLGCYWQIKRRLKYPGTRGFIGRSELKNLKKTTLNTFFEVCKMQGLIVGKHFTLNEQSSTVKFFNGSEIILADLYAYPSDPEFDSLGSLEITDAFIDEAPQVTSKAKQICKSRIRFKIDDYGLVPKLFMTGNPSKGWAYYDFYLPDQQKTLRADRKFIQALVTDNPFISPHYIESLKGLDKNSRERLLNGNWQYDDDPAALIEYDCIINCFSNQSAKSGKKFITADIARFGSDKTVIGVWDGFRVKLHSYHGLSVTESADKIRFFKDRFGIGMSDVIADEDGVGGGVVDILGCKGFVNNSVPVLSQEQRAVITNNIVKPENYVNLKSQCYFRLAERINRNEILIECEENLKQTIIEELEQVKQHNMDKDTKKAVVPKDKVKEVLGRSPDFSDTLMMREWFELAPRFKAVGA